MRLIRLLFCFFFFFFAPPQISAENPALPFSGDTSTSAQDAAPALVLTQEEQAWIAAHPRVKVGLYSVPPYIFSELGQAKGYLVDLAQKVFDQVGLTPVFSPILPLGTKLNKLRNHELDVGVGLVQTPLREDFLTFTQSPMQVQVGIYAQKDRQDINDERSVAGKTIASYQGYALGDAYLRRFTDSPVHQAPDADGMLRLVSHGEADLAFQEVNSANFLIYSSNYNNLELKGYVSEQFAISALAVDRSQPLLASILEKSYASLNFSQRNTLRKHWFEDLRKPLLSLEERAYLQAHPVVTVGHSLEFEPFFIERAPGEYDGIIVDVYSVVARRLGIEIRYVADTWEKTIRSLEQGRLDVIAMMNKRVAQEKKLLVTDAVFDNVFQVFLSENNIFPVNSLEDLVGKRVVYQDSIIVLDQYLARYQGRVQLVPALNGLEALTLLHNGKVDACIGFQSLRYLLLKHHFTDIRPVYTLGELMVDTVAAIKPGALLLQSSIAKALHSISFQEKEEITRRWFGTPGKADAESQQGIVLTAEEQQYLATQPKLSVCTRLGHYPLVGVKHDKLVGIVGEVTDEILNKLGVEYTTLLAASKEEEYQLITEQRCDLVVPLKHNLKIFDTIKTTSPVYKSVFNSVGNIDSFFIDDYTDFSGHVFYVKEDLHKKVVHAAYPDLTLQVNEDIDKVMDILSVDKYAHLVNIGIINEYLINKYGIARYKLNGEFDKLRVAGAIGVSTNSSPLLTIMNKGLENFGEERVAQIINRYELQAVPRADYRFIWYAISLSVLISFLLIYRNVLLKKSNRALALEKGRFEAFMRNASDGILIIDIHVNIQESNLKAQRMLGYSADELRELSMYDINKKLTRKMVDTNLHRLVSGNDQLMLASEYTRKDGSRLPVAITASLIELADRTCIYTSLRDISAQKDAEDRLKAAMDEAQAANRAKSVFLSHMSHELRTPLNAILGYTQLYAHDKSLSPKQQVGIQTMHSAGEHLLMLINDILDLSKIEAGKLELRLQEVALSPFLENIVKISRMRCQEKGIEFQYELDQQVPTLIQADALRLRQVLFNLLANAVKFTDQGYCSFCVEAHPVTAEQAELHFVIEDSGPGIAEAQQEEVFHPFCQAGERRKYSQGSGLGLTICRQLVDLMGGSLELESPIHAADSTSYGPGCRFTLSVVFSASQQEIVEVEHGQQKSAAVAHEPLIAPENEVLEQIFNHLQDGNIDAVAELAEALKERESGKFLHFAEHLERLAADIRLTEIEQFIQQQRGG